MREWTGDLQGKGLRIALAVSRFNEAITRRLLEGALSALRACGVAEEDIAVAWVPGSFELPVAVLHLARSGRYDAVVALGVVIRGETLHHQLVAGESARGIAQVARETGVPCIFGVVTAEDTVQALERAGGKHGNRGYDAGLSAVQMANLVRALRGEGGSG